MKHKNKNLQKFLSNLQIKLNNMNVFKIMMNMKFNLKNTKLNYQKCLNKPKI